MLKSFDNSLLAVIGGTVNVTEGNGYPEPGQASIRIEFSNGAVLTAEFWRVVKAGRAGISSFDHGQIYGLPETINAIALLRESLHDTSVIKANLQPQTGDLVFEFANEISLQVFNFTGYEIWEMRFPDGTGEYSNYVK
jgi:hypothetical protein